MESFEHSVNDENLVEKVRNTLVEIDSMDINDHAHRFEELHQMLTGAISSIDGL